MTPGAGQVDAAIIAGVKMKRRGEAGRKFDQAAVRAGRRIAPQDSDL